MFESEMGRPVSSGGSIIREESKSLEFPSIQLIKGSPLEEDHLEQVLSLDLVKHFSKLASVRALQPITAHLDSDYPAYRAHWLPLLRYETFCKLTSPASELAPLYLPQLQLNSVLLQSAGITTT
jgi:hypothetical protein